MTAKKRILVVDDNPINLGILEEMLCDEFRIEFAQNGRDAIRLAVRFQPDVVLLDVMMPGLDGLETCRRLRQIAELNEPVVIMVSAKAMPSEKAAGMTAGADDYITKPFDEIELLAILRKYTTDEARDHSRNASNITPATKSTSVCGSGAARPRPDEDWRTSLPRVQSCRASRTHR